MTDSNAGLQVVPVADLREYFRDALQGALGHQHLKVDDHTEHYVVNLLTLFSRAEMLHDDAGSRAAHRPLAALLADACEAPTLEARCHALQRLGDVSLFFAGFFAGSFGLTQSTSELCSIRPIGVNCSGSAIGVLTVCGISVITPLATSSLWPSAGERSTSIAPMLPLAPGLFSITTGWPSVACMLWKTERAAKSVWPPGP